MLGSIGLIDLSVFQTDFDPWMLELVHGGLYLGPDFGPFSVYGGVSIAGLGIDRFKEAPIASLFNPRATAGAQLVLGPVALRAEMNIGRILRLTDDPDLQIVSGLLTVGFRAAAHGGGSCCGEDS